MNGSGILCAIGVGRAAAPTLIETNRNAHAENR